MKIAKTIRNSSALLATTLSIFAGAAAAADLASFTQFNTGNITSGITLQNIQVNSVAEITSTAMGNTINGALVGGSSNQQINSGTINSSTAIMGPTTSFDTLLVKVNALGNNVGLAVNESTLKSIGAASVTQTNNGTVGASITWNLDPTNNANLSALAVGNVANINVTR